LVGGEVWDRAAVRRVEKVAMKWGRYIVMVCEDEGEE